MKVVILSDAHGNMVYFSECIHAALSAKPDKVVFLGDCFGYMREGNAILEKLRQIGAQILLGNHEAMLLGILPADMEKERVYGLEIDRKNINDGVLSYMKSLKPALEERIDNKRILYVHGRPDNPVNGYLYEDTRTFAWNQSPYDFVFMGHTHRPYVKKAGITTYVNVGSCGLPRDLGGAPSYVVFDTKTGEVEICRLWIRQEEIKKLEEKQVHPAVWECLMRGR